MAMYTTLSAVKAMLPPGLRRRIRRMRSTRSYERLYELHARITPPHEAIGLGDYDLIGRIQLEMLRMEGLKPGHTLVELGCGTGRLALHAIPMLEGGRYIGIDISRTMLRHARAALRERHNSSPCAVELHHQRTHHFRLPDRSIDMICAFSVFTHLEHEDSYRYLQGARRIIKDDGRFLFSCLPMDLDVARQIFHREAALDTAERWGGVRNVTTSRELMDSIARMAGWEPLRWYPGDQPCVRLPDRPDLLSQGQSICVLVPR
jgi:ubiquinone/menaquinone biosynthesis C-methylase UbiE